MAGRRAPTPRALEGFTRSLGKEIGRGATVNLVHVARAPRTSSSRRCGSCSRRARRTSPARSSGSAGARARRRSLGAAARRPSRSSPAPRAGSARRSPTCSSARARSSASTSRLARPRRRDRADRRLGSSSTSPPTTRPRGSPSASPDGLDILVHNAGVTKDRTLAKMPEDRWQSLMEVNLSRPSGSPRRCCRRLLARRAAGSSACRR